MKPHHSGTKLNGTSAASCGSSPHINAHEAIASSTPGTHHGGNATRRRASRGATVGGGGAGGGSAAVGLPGAAGTVLTMVTTVGGGIAAAVDGQRRGLVDHWLHPIRELYRERREELEAISDERSRLDRLCELNVMRQVRNVASDVFVQDAWARGQTLSVHGWVYALHNGLVNDLGVTVSGPAEVEALG